jgi:hypothetical protein
MMPWPEPGLGSEEEEAVVDEEPDDIAGQPEQREELVQPVAPEVDRAALPYATRNRHARVLAVAEGDMGVRVPERPPKPEVPPKAVRRASARWKAATAREVQKLSDAQVFGLLPTDDNGRVVYPADAIVLGLLERTEFKWKVDPETGEEGWLECVRLVCDGSVDNRKDITVYAETPERTLLLFTLGLAASGREHEATADVERAYLNADSLDDNIVVIAPDGIEGLPKRSLLKKGLYGTRKASLGWEQFIDGKMLANNWVKLDVCRGMYLKTRPDGHVARALRHSDDLKVSCKDVNALKEECELLSAAVKMSEWKPVKRFLGLEIERISSVDGQPDPAGNIALARQREKITEMEKRFGELARRVNPSGRVRYTPGPLDHLKEIEEMSDQQAAFLDEKARTEYQALVGSFNWLVGARPDALYHQLLLSKHCHDAREWDQHCAVWMLQYFIQTRDAPLVLGGPKLDPQTHSDSSFATMPERRTVIATGTTSGPLSGVFDAECKVTKSALTNVFETETAALSNGIKAQMFATKVCNELLYEVPQERKVFADNQSSIQWAEGTTSNKRSRHVDIKFYFNRHAVRDGVVSLYHVPTKENHVDLQTKAFGRSEHERLAAKQLGHLLIQGLGVSGVFELSQEDRELVGDRGAQCEKEPH